MTKAAYTDAEISRQMVAAVEIVRALGSEDDELTHDMIEGETGLFEAIAVALDEMRDCDIAEIGLKAKIDDLTKRKSRHVARRDKLRGLIEQAMAMAEIKSHAFTCETITIKKTPPKLIITGESEIPAKYWEAQPLKLDKSTLLNDAKIGRVAGVEMSNGGTTIQIRKS